MLFFGNRVGVLIDPLNGRCLDQPSILAELTGRAAYLAHRGLSRGDRVFIHYGNSPEFFIDLLAVWWLGGAAVPIDTRLTSLQIETLVDAAKPKFSLIDRTTDSIVTAMLADQGVKLLSRDSFVRDSDARLPPGDLRLDDVSLILFTSGTTGEPKGVVHTHRSLRARWALLRETLGLEAYQRTLCLIPTHFVHGLVSNSLFPWLHGCDLCILPPFRADNITQLGALIDKYDITFMSSVPAMWNLVLRLAKPPEKKTLRRVHCASAPLSAHMWRMVQEWSGTQEVINTYGTTEAGSWIAGTLGVRLPPEDGLVGVSWGTDIRILKSGSTDVPVTLAEVCAPGEEGHVWINSPSLMVGYLGRGDLTASVLSQGWFLTGDIGLIDERGLLYLRGRVREEINKGGLKVHPADVDRVAAQFPAVADVCTFAVEDPLYGQDVAIALVVREDKDKALEGLRAFMAARLAKHQMPGRWYVVDEIPRTSRGKINRQHVAQNCVGGASYEFSSAAH